MSTYETSIARELARRIDEEADRQSEILISGLASDFAEYKEKSAVIRTLLMVRAWISDIEVQKQT